MSEVIEVADFSKDYADVRAVDHLTFTVAAGTITGFLGPNGSGKTTTLRALLGLVEPTSGSVRIAGSRYRDLEDPLRHDRCRSCSDLVGDDHGSPDRPRLRPVQPPRRHPVTAL